MTRCNVLWQKGIVLSVRACEACTLYNTIAQRFICAKVETTSALGLLPLRVSGWYGSFVEKLLSSWPRWLASDTSS